MRRFLFEEKIVKLTSTSTPHRCVHSVRTATLLHCGLSGLVSWSKRLLDYLKEEEEEELILSWHTSPQIGQWRKRWKKNAT